MWLLRERSGPEEGRQSSEGERREEERERGTVVTQRVHRERGTVVTQTPAATGPS